MRGAEQARKLLRDRLEAAMPDKLAELTARYVLPPPAEPGTPDIPGTLPPVRGWFAGERFAIPAGSWPAIFVTRLTTPRITVADVDAGTGRTLWKVTYRLRVYVYANGQDADDVTDKVDRYTLAVRELLLIDLNLGDDAASIDPNSLLESYSGVEPEQNGRTVGASYLELDLALAELADATRPPGAPPDVAMAHGTVTVHPAHPAL